MLEKYFKIFAMVGWLIVCLGCNQKTILQKDTMLDKNWGRSYETAKYRQLLNPEASKYLDPVVGLDGQAAGHNVEKYRDSFKEKSRQETVNILQLQ